MRFGDLGKIERDISTAENGTIWHRWRYGRWLLCSSKMTTPAGNFKHGVLENLIHASGGKLSERELRYRLQCGRTYPKRSQIGNAVADFGAWRELIQAGFPPYDDDEDEPPYNPMETRELIRQHETRGEKFREDGQYEGGGLMPRGEFEEDAIIPRDTFGDNTPLSELDRWANEELELAARFSARADRVRRYVDSLIKAADGDLTVTLGIAERRLHGND